MSLRASVFTFVLLFLNSLNNGQPLQAFKESDLFVISHITNRLPIDATNPNRITLQKLTGDDNQLWSLVQHHTISSYYIINKKTGRALDYANDSNYSLITTVKSTSLNQQWIFMPNGSILNVGSGLYIDVYNGSNTVGTLVRLYQENHTPAQNYVISRQVCIFEDV